MSRDRRGAGSSGRGPSKPAGPEWVGGRVVSPFYITEGTPYRPELILWLEVPGPAAVSFKLSRPGEAPPSVGAALLEAMKSPLIGPPRTPCNVRVADAGLAAEVRRVLPGVRTVVAPTPEIQQVLEQMAEEMPAGEEKASYFEGGRVAIDVVEDLFRTARILYRVAPWKVAGDSQILRVDIPAYGVRGECLSIIGALGESFGFILFPSLDGFERFVALAQRPPSTEGPIDLGTTVLCLNFEAGADLPRGMLREALKYGWPVAGPRAYPAVQHRDRDAVLCPLGERDYRIVSACAGALTAFFVKHGHLFRRETIEPICESYVDDHDLEVRFTAPYEAEDLFKVNFPSVRATHASGSFPSGGQGRRPASEVGRNKPCPCGSGKKYKLCCLRREEAGTRGIPSPPEAEEAAPTPEHELAWLNSQRAAWLSVWEVLEVEPGRSLTLNDLLTGETRVVRETQASLSLVKRDALLARVVDHEGTSLLCGVHHRPLPPVEAALVVERIRGRLRRKGAIPIERMRQEAVGRYLIARWEEALEDLDERADRPPVLQNTDGDPLLFTADHFAFDPSDRSEIQRRLAAAEGVVDPPEPADPEQLYAFTRPGNEVHRGWERTLIGRVTLSGNALLAETNSIQRADSMERLLDASLGPLIRHRGREHTDPGVAMQEPRPAEGAPDSQLPPQEMDRIILDWKTKHYADWADHPLPALAGMTPREAARTKPGRRMVDLLLKESENHEARIPPGQRFDFSGIRRELGLDR